MRELFRKVKILDAVPKSSKHFQLSRLLLKPQKNYPKVLWKQKQTPSNYQKNLLFLLQTIKQITLAVSLGSQLLMMKRGNSVTITSFIITKFSKVKNACFLKSKISQISTNSFACKKLNSFMRANLLIKIMTASSARKTMSRI